MTIEVIEYVTIQIRAQNIAGSASVAYWDDFHREFMHGKIIEEFRELADRLGFDLVERPPVEHPQQIAAE